LWDLDQLLLQQWNTVQLGWSQTHPCRLLLEVVENDFEILRTLEKDTDKRMMSKDYGEVGEAGSVPE
jgi:hypothetical protein